MIWRQNRGWIFVKLETHRQRGLFSIAWSSPRWKNSDSLPKFKRVQEIGTKKNPRLETHVCKLSGALKNMGTLLTKVRGGPFSVWLSEI